MLVGPGRYRSEWEVRGGPSGVKGTPEVSSTGRIRCFSSAGWPRSWKPGRTYSYWCRLGDAQTGFGQRWGRAGSEEKAGLHRTFWQRIPALVHQLRFDPFSDRRCWRSPVARWSKPEQMIEKGGAGAVTQCGRECSRLCRSFCGHDDNCGLSPIRHVIVQNRGLSPIIRCDMAWIYPVVFLRSFI